MTTLTNATCFLERIRANSLALQAVYGDDPSVLDRRQRLIQQVLERFIERFGDEPVRVFRCPGRLNLRGMHVDTHGGYLNLMTHEREIVMALAATTDSVVHLTNIDQRYDDVRFAGDEAPPQSDWLDYINSDAVRTKVAARPGHWGHYLEGAWRAWQHRCPAQLRRGVRGVVGGDIPHGAALSSSAALTVCALRGFSTLNEIDLDTETLILAERDAEWYTGARTGVSDQAAMVLGQRGQLVNVALRAEALNTSQARYVVWPQELDVLVVNSYTTRSLSGAQAVEYNRNRFAYSVALIVVARVLGRPVAALPDLSPACLGSDKGVFQLLRNIPEHVSIDELTTRYGVNNVDTLYQRYFGSVPSDARPTDVALRGPLMFGIAESERARLFAPCIEAGAYRQAGRLMIAGHDGDRLVDCDGKPWRYDVSDRAIDELIRTDEPVAACPGAYGASSPVLDGLVDTALAAGALGASLTGAGIAGSVLVLCGKDQSRCIKKALLDYLQSPEYLKRSGRDAALTALELEVAVMSNHATACTGEIILT